MTGRFEKLAISDVGDFTYGISPKPIKLANGMIIGGGIVYPEINFTLPPMDINEKTMEEVKRQYREMIDGILTRASELTIPGLVVEVELLPPTTIHPEWGIEITNIVRDAMREYESRHGLKSVMRITPNDVRDMIRPPRMSEGPMLEAMLETFRGCAQAGAEFLAIESTGGKEVHDDALLTCDLQAVIFSLGVMAARDMERLWKAIVSIANETGSIPSGDTACGFGNTAMMLAEKGYIPRVFAAVVRVVSAVRSLVAYEAGAVGPSKDCAYEGPYIKAITGYPIAMEGKSAACAHFSPLGNIAAAVADLWSNESVQNVKLLAGMAPTVSIEQLAYDCRLMNTASQDGRESALKLRDWFVGSDSRLDPQAYVLRPDVVLMISKEILRESTHYDQARAAAQATIEALKAAGREGRVIISDRERPWLEKMQKDLDAMPDTEDEAWRVVKERIDLNKVVLEDYGLA